MAGRAGRWDEATELKLLLMVLAQNQTLTIDGDYISENWPVNDPNDRHAWRPSPRVTRERMALLRKKAIALSGGDAPTTPHGRGRSTNANFTPVSGSGINSSKRKAAGNNAADDDGELSEDGKVNVIKNTSGTNSIKFNQKLGISRKSETIPKRRKTNKSIFSEEESEHLTESESSDTTNMDSSDTKPSSSKLITTPRKALARRSKTPKKYTIISDGEADTDTAKRMARQRSDSADSEFDYNAHKLKKKRDERTANEATWKKNGMTQDSSPDPIELED